MEFVLFIIWIFWSIFGIVGIMIFDKAYLLRSDRDRSKPKESNIDLITAVLLLIGGLITFIVSIVNYRDIINDIKKE